ncbi:MAG TPA: TMEM175 family protein [Vicinamibacterales bacterium]|nr:TMEM175 family protein [Vicinamibacterales bacterium]
MPVPVRHREVSRLEGFSDAVFGFALTLLVVNLETPKDLAGLRDLIGSFLPFGITFAMVSWIWYQHNLFFRRYGLQDAWTAFLNCALLFVVLFYVFPLKFLTLALVGPLTMGRESLPDVASLRGPTVMAVYSTGVLLIFSLFVLLHNNAWRRRHELELNPIEEVVLQYDMRGHMLSAGLAVASLILVWLMPRQTFFAGIIYSLMGPLHAWNGFRGGAAQSRIKERQLAVSRYEDNPVA